VLGEGTLEVKAEQGSDTADAYLTLLNAGRRSVRIAISFQAASAEGARVNKVTPRILRPQKAARVKVTFAGLAPLTETVDGQLVIAGGQTPVAKTTSIAPAPQPKLPWAAWIAGLSGFLALLFFFVILGVVPLAKQGLLKKRAAGPKWSFDSWATTLTGVGALLGTVLGDATLPDVPRQIDKDSLVQLNLLFAAVLVIAPFVFQAIRPPKLSAADQESGLTGFSVVLIFSCSLTFGAVLGELATLALLSWEVIGGGVWAWIAVITVVVLAGLALYYFFVTTRSLAETDWEALAAEDAAAAAAAAPAVKEALQAAKDAGTPAVIAVAPPQKRRHWSLP
jgi:hypothetical protein